MKNNSSSGASLAEGLVVLVDLPDVFAGEPVFLAPAEEGEGLGVDVGVSHGRLVIDPCGLEAEESGETRYRLAAIAKSFTVAAKEAWRICVSA